jgi:hypothetical protein
MKNQIIGMCIAFDSLADACRFATRALEDLEWAMPGRWPDKFVLLKRAYRTGVSEQAWGGELFRLRLVK